MASDQCHILRLPVELLELLLEHISSLDLLNIRLVCKLLAEVAFDPFASEYFSQLTCFFPDPARVRRVINVTLRPHLAKYIRQVSLTLDTFENLAYPTATTCLQFVSPNDAIGKEFARYRWNHRAEEVQYHCSRHRDSTLLTRALTNLNPLQCTLDIDLGFMKFFQDHGKWAQIAQSLLAVVGDAMYPIYSLTTMMPRGNRPMRIPRRRQRDTLYLSELPDFLYATPFRNITFQPDIDEVPRAVYFGQVEQAMSAAAATPSYAETLDVIYWQKDAWDFAPLLSTMLSANHSTNLRRLTLVSVIFASVDPLSGILQQCHDTLGTILLRGIIIASKATNPWAGIFEILITMPNLTHLNLGSLWNWPSLQATAANEYCAKWECRGTGRSMVRAALMDALKNPPSMSSTPFRGALTQWE